MDIMPEYKFCPRCQSNKPTDEFGTLNRRGRQELAGYCRVCSRDYANQYYHKRVAADPAWGKQYSRKATLAQYGLTPEQYDTLCENQNGVCAICNNPPSGNGVSATFLVVDHDHATGEVRGLLCDFCNRGLGIFRDNPETLMAAAEYLVEWEGGEVT